MVVFNPSNLVSLRMEDLRALSFITNAKAVSPTVASVLPIAISCFLIRTHEIWQDLRMITLPSVVISPCVVACVRRVRWFAASDSTLFRKPASVWHRACSVPSGTASFVPVQRLAGKFAWAAIKNGEHRLQVVCPLFTTKVYI